MCGCTPVVPRPGDPWVRLQGIRDPGGSSRAGGGEIVRDPEIRERAELLRLLGHPTRLLILQELARGVKCVTDIQDLLDIPQPNVSQHLAVLRQARIVDYYEEGRLRCYYLLRPALVAALLGFLEGDYPVERRGRGEVRQEGRDRASKGPSACAR